MRSLLTVLVCSLLLGCQTIPQSKFVPLFPEEGVPAGWVVRAWANVKDPGPQGAQWMVKEGVLHGSNPRGTWLMSEKEYGDFILDFEFKLPEQGNGGCA